MKQTTIDRMLERADYITKKLGKRYSAGYYKFLVGKIFDLNIDYDDKIGYCGSGDDSCKKETLSSKLVPDFDCINWSCWFHDRLYILVEKNYTTYEIADKILKYSGYYDATKNKSGIKKAKGIIVSRVYYRGVQIRTFFSGFLGGK